jgi:leucyl aminopeptidase
MLDQTIDCIVASAEGTRPVHVVRPDGLSSFLETLSSGEAQFLRDTDFGAKAGELRLLQGADGVVGAVLGIGVDRSPFVFGNLPMQLPCICAWQLQPGDYDAEAATLGYCLGAYRYTRFHPSARRPAMLFVPAGHEASLSQAAATWMVRDLINTPANFLGPVELADFAVSLADRHGAVSKMFSDDLLRDAYPTIAAVGLGSVRPPRVVLFHWRGSTATDDSPLLSLCGKGVCFDRRLRFETFGWHAANEEGHGRRRDRLGSCAYRDAGRFTIAVGGADWMCRKFRVWHCNATIRRDPDSVRTNG